ncbi:restriction endonuclease subunit S [Desulfococcaceae bacterium HSG8]|nr:restriction endonuclease subunit S [Desulfococcaceae bacterium HSG8]
MNDKLPKGWTFPELHEIASINMGQSPKSSTYNEIGDGLPFFQGKAEFGKIYPTLKKFCTEPKKVAEKDDILLSIRAPVGPTNLCPSKACIGRGLSAIRAVGPVIQKFLLYYFRSIEEWLSQQGTGTTFRAISGNFIKELNVPLPPIPEQKRIAAKLDSLLAKVDACKARLDKVSEIIKRFRQSVLAAATSGKLTEDWREENPNVDDVNEILRKTQIYRERKYNEAITKAKSQGNKKPRPFKVNHNEIPTEELAYIPETWKKERLVNISHIQGGVTKGRKLKGRDTVYLPYLRVANVQDGFLCLDEIKEIELLVEDEDKYRLKFGDILFTEGGDRDKLGRGTVWRDEVKNCIHQNHIFRARLYCSDILPEYISIATKSDAARKYFFDNASQTVNLASINMTTLGDVPVALPPKQEQVEIVRRVEALFSIADQLQEKLNAAKSRVDKLTASILAKAFRGELVPHDPNDEPAELLLQRIRAEQEASKAKTKKGRLTKKKS